MRIVLFLMLKGTLTGGDDKLGTGTTAVAWESMLIMPGMLSIEGDQNSIDEAIGICTVYNPTEINRQSDASNSPLPVFRATMRFDVMKPDFQKQVTDRLMQQFAGRVRINWNNTL